jgi:beta-glucosidase
MLKKDLNFPKGFYWGTSTSAHQVEGGNFNDWTEWEKENAARLAEEAKKHWESWQQKKFPEMFKSENYISGLACDHYHRFKEDFEIAKSLNHNAHRFSIEWSQIEPKEGKIKPKEIEHYRQVLLALKKRGLEPFVTFYHWTLPVWLSKKGGWLNPKAPYYFDRYVKIISQNLFDEVNFWITINEPMVYTGDAYLRGLFPPQKKSVFKYLKVLNNLAKAHRLAYKSLHLIDLDCQVGISKNNWYFKNVPLVKYFRNNWFMNKIKNQQDFIGLNYYKHCQFPKKKKLLVSDLGWDFYPQGIYYLLKDLKKYKKPIYITENGLADIKDAKRIRFIKDHLKYVHQAIQNGVDVRGYFYWSLLDNFEWDKGFWPRFGLVEVDYKTMERRIRPSAFEYAQICKKNGMPNHKADF